MSSRVIVSLATTADGYMDDTSPKRLVLSNDKDWQSVYALRASCDAIVVGANTIRRDNPSLTIKSDELKNQRILRGQSTDIARVILSASGNIPHDSKIFTTKGERIIFCPKAIDVDAQVVCTPNITAHSVVRYLNEKGYKRILVEGGGEILKMFLDEGVVDYVRHATAPTYIGALGYSHFAIDHPGDYTESLDDMIIAHHYLNKGIDERYLLETIELSTICKPQNGNFSVGAILVTADRIFKGYTHQSAPNNHAEEEVIAQAIATGTSMKGATIYSSMEPCSVRKSKPKSCSQLIIEHGISRVVYALAEPDIFVKCQGTEMLRNAGVEVNPHPALGDLVRRVNAHIGHI